MIIGSGTPTPYDLPALAMLCVTAVAPLAGLALGAESFGATFVHRGTMIVANALLFGLWSWRVGRV